MLRQPRPTARPRAARVAMGRARVGVLAHRRRPIRRQPRRAPGQPLLRSRRPGLGAGVAGRVSTTDESTSPASAGARRSRSPSRPSSTSSGASSPSTPSTAWSSSGGRPTARSRSGSPTAACTCVCSRRMVSVAEPLTCKGQPRPAGPDVHARVDHLNQRGQRREREGWSDLVHGAADVVELGVTEVLLEQRQHAALLVEDEAVELVGERAERPLRRAASEESLLRVPRRATRPPPGWPRPARRRVRPRRLPPGAPTAAAPRS